MNPEPNSTNPAPTKDEAALKKDKIKKDKKEDEDLSEENLSSEQKWERWAERLCDRYPGLRRGALESLWRKVQTTTRSEFQSLKLRYQTLSQSDWKRGLKFQLLGSKDEDIGSMGFNHVRNLAACIGIGHSKRANEKVIPDDVIELVERIVAYYMTHNFETEAVDLLLEVKFLDLLVKHVDKTNYKRTCLYLTSSGRIFPGPDDVYVLDIAYRLYSKFEEFPSALQIALYLDNMQYVKQVFTSCPNLLRKKQFCYILAQQEKSYELDEEMCDDDEDRAALQEIINAKLTGLSPFGGPV